MQPLEQHDRIDVAFDDHGLHGQCGATPSGSLDQASGAG